MSAPVVPADFKALISDPTSSMCGNFVKTLLRLPVAVYKLVNWMLDSSGNPTQDFLTAVSQSGSYQFAACILPEDGTRMLCDGREISQTTYATLYAAIGATYGTAGAGNFKLPDFRARFPVGTGTFTSGASVALAGTGGEEKHLLTPGETALRAHTHNMPGNYVKFGGGSASLGGGGAQGDGGFTTGALSSGEVNATTPHNTLPPYLGVYVYIKT